MREGHKFYFCPCPLFFSILDSLSLGMKKNFLYLSLFIAFISVSCGNNTPTPTSTPPPPPVNEDDLLIRLSSELIDNPQTQAQKDKNAIINYALDNSVEVEALPSGLYYQIIETGTGEKAKWGDYVTAHYRGFTLDGKEFDSSYRRKEPLEFYIGNMIAGWNEGLELLAPKGKAIFIVPSALAYGEKGLGKTIAPHTPLAFEVELLKVEKKEK